ncbi:unnamed protein product [Fusarium graminearum]|nr:unnamed protein product [Fusarium graminearum]
MSEFTPHYAMCLAALPKAPVRAAFAASGMAERHYGAQQSADDVALRKADDDEACTVSNRYWHSWEASQWVTPLRQDHNGP